MVNVYDFYEINLWLFNVGKNFVLGDYLFGAFNLNKNVYLDKYKYSGHGNECDAS